MIEWVVMYMMLTIKKKAHILGAYFTLVKLASIFSFACFDGFW